MVSFFFGNCFSSAKKMFHPENVAGVVTAHHNMQAHLPRIVLSSNERVHPKFTDEKFNEIWMWIYVILCCVDGYALLCFFLFNLLQLKKGGVARAKGFWT